MSRCRRIAKAISQAQSDLTTTYLASGVDTLSWKNSAASKQCLVIARGHRGSIAPGLPPIQGALHVADLTTIGASDYPDLYIELIVTRLDTPSHFIMEPVLIRFANTAAKLIPGTGRKTIGVIVGFFENPTSLPAGTTAADINKAADGYAPLDFGKIARGTYVEATWDQIGTNANPLGNQTQDSKFGP